MTGRKLLHYEIVEKIGEGGMGVVYLARDLHLDRLVALKLLPIEKAADPDRLRRFVQEARTASALDHPSIPHVYDIDVADGQPFIAMEFVEGKTLNRLIPRTGLPLPDLLRYGVQVAEGLSRAHTAGIVHRDLKPANLMVSPDGRVRILDFGLAKLTEPLPATDDSATRSMPHQTSEGILVGTTAYMSPEQAEGRAVDSRSDIFSFGSLLYEMASGRPAFAADTPMATLSAILRQEPQPLEGLPAELEKLISRCLRKDPARRLQHLGDARLILEDLKEESDSGKLAAPRPLPRRRNPLTMAFAVMCVVALLSAIAWFVTRERPGKEGPSPPVLLTSFPGNEVQPSFSPDGNQVAFVWDGEKQDNSDVYVKLIGEEKPLRLTNDPAADISPAWSPDGRFIAFVRNRTRGEAKSGVYVVPAIGGPERLVTELATRFHLSASTLQYTAIAPFPLVAWAEEGRSLLYTDRESAIEPLQIYRIPVEGGEKRSITKAPRGSLGDGAMAISPDHRTLIFGRALGLTECALHRLALGNSLIPMGDPERITPGRDWNATPVWLSSKGGFLFSTGGKFDGPFRLWRMSATAGAEPHRLASYEEGGWPAYSATRGRLVFSKTTSDSNIWRVPLFSPTRAATPEKLIASTRDDGVPQYSPDGTRIVFTSNRTGEHEVWVAAANGSSAIQLTSLHAGMTGSPHWSPDGRQIVFDSNIEGQFELYTINASGGSPRRLTTHPRDDALGNYSRDGQFIYFSSNRTGSWQVWKMPAAGGEPVQVTRGGGRNAVESSDGKLLFFEKLTPRGIWKCPPDGGAEVLVAQSKGFLCFAITRDGVYFVPAAASDAVSSIVFLSFSTSVAKPVLPLPAPVLSGLSVSPDGRFLLMSQIDQRGSDLMLVENFR